MKFYKKSSSKSPRSKAISALDRVFSLFIRHRDSQNGLFKCISCGEIKDFSQADCGHYINRAIMATRYDEINCNAQCRYCNRFREGNSQGYRQGLINKYGEQAVLMLEAKKNNVCHLSMLDIEILTKLYKDKFAEMKNKA